MFFTEMSGLHEQATMPKEYTLRRKLYDKEGPVGNWRSFRRYLLHSVASTEESESFDSKRFELQIDPSPMMVLQARNREKWKLFDPLLPCFFPSLLGVWMGNSRRIFSLSPDLQMLINATSLEGIHLGDLKLPFAAFAIELPLPIVGAGGDRFDMILFGQFGEKTPGRSNGGMGLLISERCVTYTPFSLSFKREVEELARRKRWERLDRKLTFMDKHLSEYNNMHRLMFWDEADNDVPVLEHILGSSERKLAGRPKEVGLVFDDVAYQQSIRTLAGMALYLRTLPPVSKNRTEWQRVDIEPLAMPVQVITDEAQVCMLSTEFTLSPEERTVLGSPTVNEELAGCMQKNPHFRRGFWKRPHGQGHNPDAEKTIWVRPTIVNRHLLKEGELPQGASTILLK
jgi:hypothetical protein